MAERTEATFSAGSLRCPDDLRSDAGRYASGFLQSVKTRRTVPQLVVDLLNGWDAAADALDYKDKLLRESEERANTWLQRYEEQQREIERLREYIILGDEGISEYELWVKRNAK